MTLTLSLLQEGVHSPKQAEDTSAKAESTRSPVTLHINSLGTPDCRAEYTTALTAFLSSRRLELSDASITRLDRGAVLRVLDSADPVDVGVCSDAPLIVDYLSSDAAARFQAVQAGLIAAGVPHVVTPRLVRGLDYYSDTVFEFVCDDGVLGRQQATVLGGGRYDRLTSSLGGSAIPAVGWAAGIERLRLVTSTEPAPVLRIAVVAVHRGAGADAKATIDRVCLQAAESLRRIGLPVVYTYSGNIRKQLGAADRMGAAVAVLVGADEVSEGTVIVKVWCAACPHTSSSCFHCPCSTGAPVLV
jgi:histidyl-tRNA synthetase